MKVFELDIKKLGVLLLPSLLRKAKMVAWIGALLSPLGSLHGNFLNKRKIDLYRLEHNGQKCYLRKALNDAFDKENRRIRIEDTPRKPTKYLYTRAENKSVYLGKMYLNTRGFGLDEGVDFVVHLPKELDEQELEVKVLVDYYKLASKRYMIVYE